MCAIHVQMLFCHVLMIEGLHTVRYSCMLSIIIFPSVYTPFNEDEASSGGQTFLFALLNALIVVTIVVVMTVILVCLFKYRCYRVRL